MSAAILSNHRKVAPFGLNGADAGKPGRNYVLKADGETVQLGACDNVDLAAGDTFVIETPGGGGFNSQ
jgi:5-oxoprolinase (ATP-hydrolysing)